MPKTMGVRETKTKVRKEEILQAALSCFTEFGYTGTKIEHIVERSGASIGSIYHHFGGKEDVAAALYLFAVRQYREGVLDSLTGQENAEAGVKNLVRYQIAWIEKNTELTAFLLNSYPGKVRELINTGLLKSESESERMVVSWFKGLIKQGEIAALDPSLYRPLISGGIHEFARIRLNQGQELKFPKATAEQLEKAVWSSLAPS